MKNKVAFHQLLTLPRAHVRFTLSYPEAGRPEGFLLGSLGISSMAFSMTGLIHFGKV